MRGRTLRTGTTVVTVTFKNIKTAKSTAKKYRCVVKAAIEQEPEKPVEEAKATKITEAKAATAKTISVTFDGVVDTSTATAIKVERGTTGIAVTAKYADDKKSVVLTSDTSLAAGTYTVTVGSLAPVSFNVTKQTPTTLNITNSTIANQNTARVYFQVLDQYGEAMTNYTDAKLNISAYNVTKGHAIAQGAKSKKDYFVLNCSTETVAAGGSFLNAIGDKISIVAYLTDNASVSCTKELEIVRVYTNELSFGDVKLGNDKRVTVNKTYQIDYTAKDTEGNAVTFDEKARGVNDDALRTAATAATVIIDNYNFISSNISAVRMDKVYVDANGKLNFIAEGTPGTAVITAINTITGETSSITIVVANTAKLSSLDIADASVACNASFNATWGNAGAAKFKAAVTAYDQFGEVIDPKNVKNISIQANGTTFAATAGTYFNSITATPSGKIGLAKITDDGKYVEYQVLGDISSLKNQSVRFDFVSKEMGETGYIRTTSTVSVDDEIEASALEIVKKPDATVSETKKVSVQFAVKDQYQNKMALTTAAAINGGNSWAYQYEAGAMTTANSYVVAYESTNGVVASTAIKNGDDDKVYKVEFQAPAISDLSETGTFTLKLMDNNKVIASETFDLTVVDSIQKYCTRITNGYKFKAGETVKVEVDAYSADGFNPNYNESRDVTITANNAKTYSKTIKFVNGTASFELTAGTKTAAGVEYSVVVADKNARADGGAAANTAAADAAKYVVVGNSAGKIAVDAATGHLVLQDSQGNPTTSGGSNTFATIKVMDSTTNTDITGGLTFDGNALNADNTLPIVINSNNEVTSIAGGSYSFAAGVSIATIPVASQTHNVTLSITIGDLTWSKTVANPGATATFSDAAAVEAVAVAKIDSYLAGVRSASAGAASTSSGAVNITLIDTNITNATGSIISWTTGAGVTVATNTAITGKSFAKNAINATAAKQTASNNGDVYTFTYRVELAANDANSNAVTRYALITVSYKFTSAGMTAEVTGARFE